MVPLPNIVKRPPCVMVVAVLTLIIGVGIAIFTVVNAQTDASVTPLTPGYGGPNYDQPLWTITHDKAIIPVSFTSYNCTSAALVLEYATWADYTKVDWQTGATGKYTGFIPASAPDLSQKVTITIPSLNPSTSYIFRVGAKCTSSSPMGSLAYTTSANQFATPAVPPPPSITFSGRATFQSGDAGGSIGNNALIAQKVINLQNTGSNPDTFRTTLPVNPETRCGLNGPNGSYPANTLPNTLPTTLDIPLAVNGTTYIVAVCVTNGLPAGPFTWSFKTVSVGALQANRSDVNPVIAEVQDTVNVTVPIVCGDSDGGINASVKGIATGTYAGARSDYIAIYGQEPNPNSPKVTTDKFSTFIDHCSWDVSQLNEGYCDGNGRLQAIGIRCPNGCSNGVCTASPSSVSSLSSSSPLSSRSASASTLSTSSLSTSTTSAGQITTPVSSNMPVLSVTTPSPTSPYYNAAPRTSSPALLPALNVSQSIPAVSGAISTPQAATQPLRSSQIRVLQYQRKLMLRELFVFERYFRRIRESGILAQVRDFIEKITGFNPSDTTSFDTISDFQDELDALYVRKASKLLSGSGSLRGGSPEATSGALRSAMSVASDAWRAAPVQPQEASHAAAESSSSSSVEPVFNGDAISEKELTTIRDLVTQYQSKNSKLSVDRTVTTQVSLVRDLLVSLENSQKDGFDKLRKDNYPDAYIAKQTKNLRTQLPDVQLKKLIEILDSMGKPMR